MISPSDIEAREARLRAALEAAVGVRSRRLDVGLRRAGRLLPRAVHARASIFAEARRMAGHPKLARQIDDAALAAAESDILAMLDTIDRADLRRGRWLGIAGVIAFNMLVVFGLFIWWLVWSGNL